MNSSVLPLFIQSGSLLQGLIEKFCLDWLCAMSSASQFHYFMKAPGISGSVFNPQFHDPCKLITAGA